MKTCLEIDLKERKMGKPILKYLCRICFKTHKDLESAEACCIQKQITSIFECDECGRQFYKEERASECCSNIVKIS